MLNVSKPDIVNYVVRVAIPFWAITEQTTFVLKEWSQANMISENITGGPHSVSVAFKAMDAYVGDYQKTIPAIPFQSLITDRSVEADTSKWITKIYYRFINGPIALQ